MMLGEGASIVVIDDEKDSLERMTAGIREALRDATVEPWFPDEARDPAEEFEELTGDGTVLVVADYDLTRAVKGLFGHSVVAWCRNRFIPVGDFSRGHVGALATEADLFDLRVPRDETDAVEFIARVYKGFRRVRMGIEADPSLVLEGRSPAQVLARLLGRPELEGELGPYLSRPGLFNAWLLDTLMAEGGAKVAGVLAEKTRLLTYILGHVLVNAVMRYPGPVLGEGPLCAYLATSSKDADRIAGVFEEAAYSGPFDSGERFFWRDRVDAVVDRLADEWEVSESAAGGFGDYHRAVVSKALGRPAANHGCERCGGTKGGFWCPFTKRAVCELEECSSASSSWVPTGAYACRVERDFFDEWSPVLGF